MQPISLPVLRPCGSAEQLPDKEEVGQEGELHLCMPASMCVRGLLIIIVNYTFVVLLPKVLVFFCKYNVCTCVNSDVHMYNVYVFLRSVRMFFLHSSSRAHASAHSGSTCKARTRDSAPARLALDTRMLSASECEVASDPYCSH